MFGVQEALADQLQYLDEECPQYARVGVGRDDGDKAGETMAIYYLRDRFDLLDSGTLWLSETPDRPSRGWDGACNRTMTWAELRDRTSGKTFFYFNTHLDHKGKTARAEGVKLVVAQIAAIAGKAPAILGGDFNTPTDSPIFRPLTKAMKSARDKAPETDREGTFNGFGSAPDTIVIDHLYFRGKLKCLRFATLTGRLRRALHFGPLPDLDDIQSVTHAGIAASRPAAVPAQHDEQHGRHDEQNTRGPFRRERLREDRDADHHGRQRLHRAEHGGQRRDRSCESPARAPCSRRPCRERQPENAEPCTGGPSPIRDAARQAIRRRGKTALRKPSHST